MGAFDVRIELFLFKRKDSASRVLDLIGQVRPTTLQLLSNQGPDRHERAPVAEVRESVPPYGREVLNGYPNAFNFDPASPNKLAALMSGVIAGRISRSRAVPEGPRLTSGGAAWARAIKVFEGYAREGKRDQ